MEGAKKVPSYRAWGKDKVVHGPLDLSTLIQWIKDEKVTADDWLYCEPDERWRKAAEVPELQGLFRPKPPGSPAESVVARRGRDLGVNAEALRRMKCFAGMDDLQLESFVRYMELIRCQQFSHIVRKGEHGDAMYLVLEGEVRALAMVDSKESTLTTITAGEYFGEISVIDQGPRSSDVVANKDSVLLKLSSTAFERLLREAPALAVPFLLALSRSVIGRVRVLTNRFEDSVHLIRMAQAVR